jgi:hypothetical protein
MEYKQWDFFCVGLIVSGFVLALLGGVGGYDYVEAKCFDVVVDEGLDEDWVGFWF